VLKACFCVNVIAYLEEFTHRAVAMKVTFHNDQQKLQVKLIKGTTSYILPTGVRVSESVLRENGWTKQK